MCVLAHRFNYKFEKHEIFLCGAYSRISLKPSQGLSQSPSAPSAQKYELYMPSNEDRFNMGLVYLLDALKLLNNHVDS